MEKGRQQRGVLCSMNSCIIILFMIFMMNAVIRSVCYCQSFVRLTVSPDREMVCPGDTVVYTCQTNEQRMLWSIEPVVMADDNIFDNSLDMVGTIVTRDNIVLNLTSLSPFITTATIAPRDSFTSANVTCISGSGTIRETLEYVIASTAHPSATAVTSNFNQNNDLVVSWELLSTNDSMTNTSYIISCFIDGTSCPNFPQETRDTSVTIPEEFPSALNVQIRHNCTGNELVNISVKSPAPLSSSDEMSLTGAVIALTIISIILFLFLIVCIPSTIILAFFYCQERKKRVETEKQRDTAQEQRDEAQEQRDEAERRRQKAESELVEEKKKRLIAEQAQPLATC